MIGWAEGGVAGICVTGVMGWAVGGTRGLGLVVGGTTCWAVGDAEGIVAVCDGAVVAEGLGVEGIPGASVESTGIAVMGSGEGDGEGSTSLKSSSNSSFESSYEKTEEESSYQRSSVVGACVTIVAMVGDNVASTAGAGVTGGVGASVASPPVAHKSFGGITTGRSGKNINIEATRALKRVRTCEHATICTIPEGFCSKV